MKSILLIMLFICVLSSILFSQSDVFQTAENFYKDKNYQAAIKSYQSVIKQSPNYEPAWFGLQNAYLQNGDLKQAQQSIKIELSDRLLWGQIRVLFYAHQFDTIPYLIFDLTRQYPKSEFVNNALDLGIILTVTKEDTAALKKYSQALYAYERDNYDDGIKIMKELIAKSNALAEYSYLLLTKMFLTKNETNQAIGTLNELITKFRKSRLIPRARYELGLIYLELLKDSIMAKDIFEDLISDFPESPESFFARSQLAVLGKNDKTK